MNKKDILPIALTSVGCVGTVISTYLGIKAGIAIADMKVDNEDADKNEILKVCIPAGISCGVTIGCNIASSVVSHKQRNDILSAAAVIGSSYVGYRQEVIKRYGEETDKNIVDTVNSNCYICAICPDIPDKKRSWIIDMCDEKIPKYVIEAYERDIINAEKHLNRNYILKSQQSFADFLILLGFKSPNSLTNKYGWAIDDSEIYTIDFEHIKIDDNTFRVVPIFSPWYDYENLDMFGEPY